MSIATQSPITREVAHADCGGPEDIVVRRPSEEDVLGLATLFLEMQAHYERPVSYEAAVTAATLACRPPVNTFDPRVLIALVGDDVVGSIVMNVTFPAFELSLSLHIRDLYVGRSMRRSGVGRLLVKSAARTRCQGRLLSAGVDNGLGEQGSAQDVPDMRSQTT